MAEPALAKVTIFEVAERPWGWLTTSAEVDDRVYVGSREWRQQSKYRTPPSDSGPIYGSHIEDWQATPTVRPLAARRG